MPNPVCGRRRRSDALRPFRILLAAAVGGLAGSSGEWRRAAAQEGPAFAGSAAIPTIGVAPGTAAEGAALRPAFRGGVPAQTPFPAPYETFDPSLPPARPTAAQTFVPPALQADPSLFGPPPPMLAAVPRGERAAPAFANTPAFARRQDGAGPSFDPPPFAEEAPAATGRSGYPSSGAVPGAAGSPFAAGLAAPPAGAAACATCPVYVREGSFPGSILLPGTALSIRPGGFFKFDFIHDFNPIGSTDQFNPRTIPTDGRTGENTVLQGKASRFNLDLRTPTELGEMKGFVEADFFNSSATLRLRHAYVEVGPLLAGQTWTTFTHIEALPETLDLESPVSFLVTRQGLVRWTTPINERWEAAGAVENPYTQLSLDLQGLGYTPMQPYPDLVGRVRYTSDWGQFQVAGLYRRLGSRSPTDELAYEGAAALNFTGFVRTGERDRFIYQVIFGDGAARYRGGDDLVVGPGNLPLTRNGFGWLAAYTHYWNDRWRTTGVYNVVDGATDAAQPPSAIANTDYLALNLICSPTSKMDVGAEYLYGSRTDRDGARGVDHRIQISMYYYLR